jgi:deoxyribose-phosphate aldolase
MKNHTQPNTRMNARMNGAASAGKLKAEGAAGTAVKAAEAAKATVEVSDSQTSQPVTLDEFADPLHAARSALTCLDLTSLNDADTEADIEALCQRAVGRYGKVAAVCVWPRFAARARALLPPEVAVAAVANFPDGGTNHARAVRDTQQIVQAGAQEVDVVMPYRTLIAAPALLDVVRNACQGLRLKVILETGELNNRLAVALACRIALDAGADFLKTSTGKTQTSATLQAAQWLLQAIAADAHASTHVGFKASGGLRTLAQAAPYMALTAQHLGAAAVAPARFRLGASSLLADIETVLSGGAAQAPAHNQASGKPGTY